MTTLFIVTVEYNTVGAFSTREKAEAACKVVDGTIEEVSLDQEPNLPSGHTTYMAQFSRDGTLLVMCKLKPETVVIPPIYAKFIRQLDGMILLEIRNIMASEKTDAVEIANECYSKVAANHSWPKNWNELYEQFYEQFKSGGYRNLL